jgi:hypothetical protein
MYFAFFATLTTAAAPQLLPAADLARYQAALPQVAYKALEEIFRSPETIWWDKETMIPSYQDSVGDGSYTPIGARANSQGKGVIVPEGKRLFSENGETWSFPFSHTAGTDRATNLLIVNFMWLPSENGAQLPIVYSTVDNNSALGGLGLHQWTWMYPKGAVLGEVMFLRDANGALYATEIRTRKRYLEGWATNAFRPFPTALSLAAAIKTARPNWMAQTSLAAFVAHLEDNSTLEAASLSSPAFDNIVTFQGFVDPLPALGDEALVKELLTTTPFISAYGERWKSDGARATFAPSTTESFGFVPNHYEAGLLEVRESTCTQCHVDAGRSINDFEPAAVLYGDIWGSDQIFSFHPWDQSQYVNFNYENRVVRPELGMAGTVVRYDPSQHPDRLYRRLP